MKTLLNFHCQNHSGLSGLLSSAIWYSKQSTGLVELGDLAMQLHDIEH